MQQNVHRSLMPYLGGRYNKGQALITLSSKVYRCPSSQDLAYARNWPTQYSNTNYCPNGVFLNRKTAGIKRSSEIIAISESRFGWNVSALRPYPALASITPGQSMNGVEYAEWIWVETGYAGSNNLLNFTLHARNTRGNACYLDGHAASMNYKDVLPRDFGLTDGNPTDTYQGKYSDNYATMSAPKGSGRTYNADLR
jgi:prepilin-type processing-associated H-X9-DG protein